jgi:hypothetical protein
MKLRIPLFFTGILVMFLSLMPACTAQSDNASKPTTTLLSTPVPLTTTAIPPLTTTTISNTSTSIAPTQSTTSKPGTIQKLLKLMPASVMQDDRAVITINDYAKIRQLYGIPLPASDSEQDMTNYITSLYDAKIAMGQRSYISGLDSYALKGPIRTQNVGFGAPNVDAEIFTGYPPTILNVLSGSFNPSTTKDVFNKQDGWPKSAKDKFSSEVYKNVTIYSWGSDDSQNFSVTLLPPDFDNLGRARPLAVTKNNVFYSNSIANIKSMIDLTSDESLALTSLPQYASIADGLTELNVYSASIGKDARSGTKDTSQSPLLRKYLAYATGIGKDEKGPYMALLLTHEDSNAAGDNAKILKTRIENVSISITSNGTTPVNQLWSKTVTDVQVYSKGNLVLAKLYTQNSGLWHTLDYGMYPLLLHE